MRFVAINTPEKKNCGTTTRVNRADADFMFVTRAPNRTDTAVLVMDSAYVMARNR